jgi:hypothetical protein
VTKRARLFDRALRRFHRLRRKTLQPKNARQECPCCQSLVELKANNARSGIMRDVIRKEPFNVPPRTALIASIVVRDSDHSLADYPIGWLGRDGRELPRQFESFPIFELSEGAQRA